MTFNKSNFISHKHTCCTVYVRSRNRDTRPEEDQDQKRKYDHWGTFMNQNRNKI